MTKMCKLFIRLMTMIFFLSRMLQNVTIVLVIQKASSISKNNNTTSQNINSFSNEKNIFLEHSGFPPAVTFLWHLKKKDIAAIFYAAFCSKLFTICHFVTIAYTWLICKQTIWYLIYTLLLLCPLNSKSGSSAVECSPGRPKSMDREFECRRKLYFLFSIT